MDQDEYERRRSAFEEIYRNDLELVRAAHEARLRSLEALWRSQSPEPLPASVAPRAPPPAPAAVPKPRHPNLRKAIEAAFPQLPDQFEKKDVIAALGWTPSRGGLYQALLELAVDGWLKITPSVGRHPSQYRKL